MIRGATTNQKTKREGRAPLGAVKHK